jgi:hypothetical protein
LIQILKEGANINNIQNLSNESYEALCDALNMEEKTEEEK